MLSYRVIGRHIRAARMRLEMKQAEVAEKTNISLAYYGKMERGEIRPNLDRLASICKVLRLPLEEIFVGAYETDTVMDNTAPTAEAFAQYFIDLGGRIDEKTKAVIMGVCAQIASLEVKEPSTARPTRKPR